MKKLWALFCMAVLFMGGYSVTVHAADIPAGAGEFHGHYYYVFPNGTCGSYDEAAAYCEKRGGHLAVIGSEEENAYVYKYMMEQRYQISFFGYRNTKNGWEWVDGSKGSYTNWDSQEQEGRAYARYKDGSGGRWVDDSWGNFYNESFICEWDGSGAPVKDAAAVNIPAGAGKYGGHSYYVFPGGTCASYDEAVKYCEQRGGYLAVITSEKENAYVYKYMTGKGCDAAFFGYRNTKNGWEWADGSKSGYTNWSPGEPKGRDYARYESGGSGRWADDSWDGPAQTAFICEWEKGAVSIAKASVSLPKNTYKYTGKAIKPAVKVSLNGKTLKKGTDYTVAYSNNKKAGTAKVVVKGKGNYSGSVTKKFKIKK